MITLRCHTNLDLFREVWPTQLPVLPRVGDVIQSETVHPNSFTLELEVASVRFISIGSGMWLPQLYLYMTSGQKRLPGRGDAAAGSITAFYQWYAPNVGKSVSFFI